MPNALSTSCAVLAPNLSRNTYMALIKDRKLAHDSWQLLEPRADGALPSIPEDGDVIVPLSAWRALRNELTARRGRLGVWLGGSDEPAEVSGELQHFQVIAVR